MADSITKWSVDRTEVFEGDPVPIDDVAFLQFWLPCFSCFFCSSLGCDCVFSFSCFVFCNKIPIIHKNKQIKNKLGHRAFSSNLAQTKENPCNKLSSENK